MRFLTWLWLPWWLLLGLYLWTLGPHHKIQEQGAMAVWMFAYGGLAGLLTLVYALTRVFRRASRDAAPRR